MDLRVVSFFWTLVELNRERFWSFWAVLEGPWSFVEHVFGGQWGSIEYDFGGPWSMVLKFVNPCPMENLL